MTTDRIHARPNVPWDRTVIYEAHVRGMTMLSESVPVDLRGTYAGFAHPSVTEHLQHLGVTTVELLPVFAHTTEGTAGTFANSSTSSLPCGRHSRGRRFQDPMTSPGSELTGNRWGTTTGTPES